MQCFNFIIGSTSGGFKNEPRATVMLGCLVCTQTLSGKFLPKMRFYGAKPKIQLF